jgi:hypothetical protein
MEITKQFFIDNPLGKLPMPALIDFRINIFKMDSVDAKIAEIANEMKSEKQRKEDAAEIEAVKKIQTVDELILAMRKYKGPNTEGELAHIALNMEDEALPKIVELFYRNRSAAFLEKAELILYYADRKYLDELFRNYDKIQSPYAQSMICFLIGKAEYENVDGFLLRQYQFMKLHYPAEHYHEFPLFALYNLHPDLAYADEDNKKARKHKKREKK